MHADRAGGTLRALPPFPSRGGGGGWQQRQQWGGGLTRLGCGAGAHRALGEPVTGPWEGGGGRHLPQGTQSIRRAMAIGLGGGRVWGGGGAQLVPDP